MHKERLSNFHYNYVTFTGSHGTELSSPMRNEHLKLTVDLPVYYDMFIISYSIFILNIMIYDNYTYSHIVIIIHWFWYKTQMIIIQYCTAQ